MPRADRDAVLRGNHDDIHFTPGVPRTFLLGVSLYF